MSEALTFDLLRAVNRTRCKRWHPGFGTSAEQWSGADWSNAMCGEAGETANVVKKLRRIETGADQGPDDPPPERLLDMLADEIADTVIYADLLAAHYGIDLGVAVASKFNRVSARQGFPDRLPVVLNGHFDTGRERSRGMTSEKVKRLWEFAKYLAVEVPRARSVGDYTVNNGRGMRVYLDTLELVADALPALLDVVEAAKRHAPLTVDMYQYGCLDGLCEHEECPVTPTKVCRECFDLWTQDGARTEDFNDRLLWPCPIGAALGKLDGDDRAT